MTKNKQQIPVICLDGPSGVGKGTVCLAVAEQLNWHILDSGSLYRICALATSRQYPDTELSTIDETRLIKIAKSLAIEYQQKNNQLKIILNNEDISQQIRAEDVGEKASQIAIIPTLRSLLLERQRAFLQMPGLVADGRDMGTVVFPQARLKIYLTANAKERAKRRYKQLKQKGINANLARLVEDLQMRDARDTNRTTAPLKPAADAIVIDTTTLSIGQVIDTVLQHAKQRLK